MKKRTIEIPDEVDAWLKRAARANRGSTIQSILEKIVRDAYTRREPQKIPHWDAVNPVFYVLRDETIQAYLQVGRGAIYNWRKHMGIPEPGVDMIHPGKQFRQRIRRAFFGQEDPVEFANYIVRRRSRE